MGNLTSADTVCFPMSYQHLEIPGMCCGESNIFLLLKYISFVQYSRLSTFHMYIKLRNSVLLELQNNYWVELQKIYITLRYTFNYKHFKPQWIKIRYIMKIYINLLLNFCFTHLNSVKSFKMNYYFIYFLVLVFSY